MTDADVYLWVKSGRWIRSVTLHVADRTYLIAPRKPYIIGPLTSTDAANWTANGPLLVEVGQYGEAAK